MIGDLPPPTRPRHALRGMMLSLIALIAWAGVAQIDQVTRAPAQLIVASRTQLIQSADGGIVTALHIKEGEHVRTGQLLATLQKQRAEAAVSDSSAKVAALRIAVARLNAEVYGKPLAFDKDLQTYPEYIRSQTDLYNKRQSAYRSDISSLENILRLAESELTINRKLEATGDVSRAEILRIERSVADVRAQLAAKRHKYSQDAQTELTKAQEELNTQTEQLRDRNQVLEHTDLTAPMDGIVNNIKVNTIGGVVRQGDTVLELLPTEDQLIVEAKVPPSDIAFIAIGQEAHISLDAYDASIFGAMHGKVIYISPDVVSEETRQGPLMFYKVRVLITGTEQHNERAHQIQLRPGLTATVDIKTSKRTVLSYLTKPLSKTLRNSLGER